MTSRNGHLSSGEHAKRRAEQSFQSHLQTTWLEVLLDPLSPCLSPRRSHHSQERPRRCHASSRSRARSSCFPQPSALGLRPLAAVTTCLCALAPANAQHVAPRQCQLRPAASIPAPWQPPLGAALRCLRFGCKRGGASCNTGLNGFTTLQPWPPNRRRPQGGTDGRAPSHCA